VGIDTHVLVIGLGTVLRALLLPARPILERHRIERRVSKVGTVFQCLSYRSEHVPKAAVGLGFERAIPKGISVHVRAYSIPATFQRCHLPSRKYVTRSPQGPVSVRARFQL
jgi:hypothetical protein